MLCETHLDLNLSEHQHLKVTRVHFLLVWVHPCWFFWIPMGCGVLRWVSVEGGTSLLPWACWIGPWPPKENHCYERSLYTQLSKEKPARSLHNGPQNIYIYLIVIILSPATILEHVFKWQVFLQVLCKHRAFLWSCPP